MIRSLLEEKTNEAEIIGQIERKYGVRPESVRGDIMLVKAEWDKDALQAVLRRKFDGCRKRADLLGNKNTLTFDQILDKYEKSDGTCSYCGGKNRNKAVLIVDHIVPLANGGDNAIDNINLACSVCNSIKGKKDICSAFVEKKKKP